MLKIFTPFSSVAGDAFAGREDLFTCNSQPVKWINSSIHEIFVSIRSPSTGSSSADSMDPGISKRSDREKVPLKEDYYRWL
nr:hypothetical protein [uncultured Methanospirillum sp.]